ncbi:MAG: hypothetical protein Q9174_002146 [Haloplaca sp. 1 TL-2023]
MARAYHLNNQDLGHSPHRAAPLILGIFFAASTNALPATLLTLMHLLDTNAIDPTLLSRVQSEVDSVPEVGDGTLDIKRLLELPLLQSVYTEVLRLHVDVIIARNLDADIVVPVGHGGEDTPQVRLPKGDMVVAPVWTVHNDSDLWPGVSPDHFDGERFLVAGEKGQKVFSMGGPPGRWAPYGGGRHWCPGRLFAKQEIMATVSVLLRKYNIETAGYLDARGKRTKKPPGVRSKLPGAGVLSLDGDILMRIKRRDPTNR